MKALEKITKIIDKVTTYVEDKGIPIIQDRMVDHYLNMNRSELLAMSSEDLAVAAYEISSKAYYLQDFINEKQTKWDACQQQIQKTVGNKLNEYDVWSVKEKWYAAIIDNDYATELYELQQNVGLIISRTNFLSKKLESIGNCISQLQRLRGNKNGY